MIWRKRKSKIWITVILSFALQNLTALGADNGTDTALILRQTHYFLGTSTVTITKDALRLENISQLKFIVVAKAPLWRVIIFRTDDKTYFDESIKEFNENGLMSTMLIPMRDHNVDEKIYRYSSAEAAGFKLEQFYARRDTFSYIKLHKSLPVQAEQILYSLYRCPTNGGIPVEVTGTKSGVDWVTGMKTDGARDSILTTSKITKALVKENIFELPAGFGRAKSIREVVSGTAAVKQSKDFDELFHN
jgi:hypothetical protein